MRSHTLFLGFALCLILCGQAQATTYYMASPAAGGLDSNDGLSLTSPWLTPAHNNLYCGDVIVATPGTYDYNNLQNFGFVSCSPSHPDVAWLKCQVFGQCKVTVPDGYKSSAITVGQSYWGVQGWWATNNQSNPDAEHALGCFSASPQHGATIHHIIFANNIAISCSLSGFGGGYLFGSGTQGNGNPTSVDYLTIVDNIAWGSGNNTAGGSNISVFDPIASDSAPGTHIYIARNFAMRSFNPYGCCYDGNGINLDHFDNSGIAAPFGQQAVVQNNFTLGNGGVGVRLEYNNEYYGSTTGPFATYIADHNTSWGNSGSLGRYQMNGNEGGDIQVYMANNTTVQHNLAVTGQAQMFDYSGSDPRHGTPPFQADTEEEGQLSVQNNWFFSPYQPQNGFTNWVYDTRNPTPASAFQFSDISPTLNSLTTDPQLTNPTDPTDVMTAPDCTGYTDVPSCMATVIHNFTPQASGAQSYGYQAATSTPVQDPLIPAWLSNVTGLPSGIITPKPVIKTQVDSGSSVF